MNRTLTLALPLAISLAAVASAAADPRPTTDTGPAPHARGPAAADAGAMPLVVSPAWLAAHLADRDLVILHVGDGDAYRTRHLPGGRLVALSDISVSMQGDKALHLELPAPEDLRHRLEALGISNDSRVVVYFADDWTSPATRVVFTLDAAGLGAHAALLDGGMPTWLRAGHPVTEVVPPARTGKLARLAMRPIVVDANAVLASLGKPGFAVVDARDKAYYDGTQTGGMHGHPHRTGHIAGAVSIPYDSVFDDRLVLRASDDLAARFTRAGVKPGDTVIGYCHIGQQATAMLFAARRLGHPVLLYDGAFEDWSQFYPVFPVETTPGAAPATPNAPDRATDQAPGKANVKAPAGQP